VKKLIFLERQKKRKLLLSRIKEQMDNYCIALNQNKIIDQVEK
jgi:hypothetical protein